MALAKRRLVGFEHHAEDVVSLAMMKWARIAPNRGTVARIEQVIKTEAYSFLRSEQRARDRDTKAFGDRALPIAGTARPHSDQETVLLRRALAETCRRERAAIRARDIEVLELLLAGFSLSEVVRRTGFTRHQVRTSQKVWQDLLRKTISEPTADRSPTPRS